MSRAENTLAVLQSGSAAAGGGPERAKRRDRGVQVRERRGPAGGSELPAGPPDPAAGTPCPAGARTQRLEVQREESSGDLETTGRVQPERRGRSPQPRGAAASRGSARTGQALLHLLRDQPAGRPPAGLVDRLEDPVVAEKAAGPAGWRRRRLRRRRASDTTLAQIDTRLEFHRAELTSAQKEMEELQMPSRAVRPTGSSSDRARTRLREHPDPLQCRGEQPQRGAHERTDRNHRPGPAHHGDRECQRAAGAGRPEPPEDRRLRGRRGGRSRGPISWCWNFSTARHPRPAELINRFNITPIATIPYMESRRRRLVRRGGIVAATLLVSARRAGCAVVHRHEFHAA